MFEHLLHPLIAFCASIALLTRPAQAANAADEMNGIGMPIFFMVMLVCMTFVMRAQLVHAFHAARKNPPTFLCFCTSIVNMALSIILYFSTAYNYGLVMTVIAYSMVYLATSGSYATHAQYLLAVYLLWFLFLLGFPSAWGTGIIVATNTADCNAFYSTFASTMCADGWLTFVKIVACVVVGLNMFALLLIVGMVMGMENEILPPGMTGGGDENRSGPAIRQGNGNEAPGEDTQRTSYRRI